MEKFELELAPRITKEFILSKVSQEEIFEFYLGVPVKKGNFCSPSVIEMISLQRVLFIKTQEEI